MQLGMRLYQAPALLQQMNCTECGASISDTSVGTTEEAILINQSQCQSNTPDLVTEKCSKCGRVMTKTAKTPKRKRRDK